MEHLLPLKNPSRSLEVPVFGPEVYDNLGFITYPDRRGWEADHLRDPDYGGRSATDAASFAQAWLYFGTLSEVTGIPIRGANLIRVGKAGRLLVTTERLHFYLDRWRQETMDEKDEVLQKRSFRRAKICLEFAIQYTYMMNSLLVPEHPEVAVSIEMLLISLFGTFTAIYGSDSWNAAPSIFPGGEVPRWKPGTNRQVMLHLKDQMVSRGWCQHRLESFGECLFSDSLYTVSLLGTDDLLMGHASCSENTCVGNQIDDATYNNTPRHVLEGCACNFINADIAKTIEIIERGQIPLAMISVGADNRVRLDVTPYEPGMSYIAISHVWSHGLGNPEENALRQCQLHKLQRLVNSCRGDPELATVYFWVDTLCLPLGPSHWRKVAMRQMRQCYTEASIVLVLDKHLQRATAYGSSAEMLLHIGVSDWRFRVWTLQEGFFAKKLMFQFMETAVDAEGLLNNYLSSVSASGIDSVGIFVLHHVAPALGIELYEQGRRGTRRTKNYSIASLATSLRGRAISKPEDEPLCAASLLEQDHILRTLLDVPKEERMKAFWRAQNHIPSWVPFVDGPRLTDAGYQWAPSTLRWPGMTVQSQANDHGTLLPDGLQIIKPGFVLLNREPAEHGTSDRVIGLRDETGSSYYVIRSFDEFNPPFPVMRDDTTLAVVVLEWSETYEPQVIVAVVLDKEPSSEYVVNDSYPSDILSTCDIRQLMTSYDQPSWLSDDLFGAAVILASQKPKYPFRGGLSFLRRVIEDTKMHQFCVICGVLIQPTSQVDQDLEWYQLVRVVHLRGYMQEAKLSGIGYINSSDQAIAPPDHRYSYRHSDELQAFEPLYAVQGGFWNLFCHAACWMVLLQRVGIREGEGDIDRFCTVFHNLIYCSPWNHRYLRPGHDFGGSTQFQMPVGDYIRAINQGHGYFLSDPSQFHDMREMLGCFEPWPCPEDPGSGTRAGCDIFSRLPLEILHIVLAMLPSVDIRHLRLASRSVSPVARLPSLPQSFWRSRFCPDFEMGFALPADTNGFHDWGAAYSAIKKCLTSTPICDRLKNRRRLWWITDFNASLLSQHMGMTSASADRGGSVQLSRLMPQEMQLSSSVGTLITTKFTSQHHSFLASGSREVCQTELVLPLDDRSLTRFWVATTTFNAQMFISGVGFSLFGALEQHEAEYQMGYLIPDTTETVAIPEGYRFSGFELASRLNGIAGIRVVLQNGPHTYMSPWVGDIGKGEPQIAFGRLRLDLEKCPIRVNGSLDAFKILALGIFRGSQRVSGRSRCLQPEPIWTPSYPRQEPILCPEPPNPSYQSFNPILNVDFGGSQGERLRHITRIVFHVLGHSALIVGLAFYLDHRDPIHFGRQGAMELSYFLNGPAGERITRVYYDHASVTGVIDLELHTNFGNELCFTADVLKGHRYTRRSPYEQKYCMRKVEPPEGHQITGFTAALEVSVGSQYLHSSPEADHLKAVNGSFQTLGLQCEPALGKLGTRSGPHYTPRHVISSRLASQLGSEMIGEKSNGCRGYTSAALEGIKRIRVSMGYDGRPRCINEISGLWIEYYGSPPVVVGQWISETGIIEVESGAKVTAVTIWLSKIGWSFGQKHHLGRVTRVSLSISTEKQTFPSGGSLLAPDSHMVLKFEANRLEDLSHLVWVFNDNWDFPRVTSRSKTLGKQISLWDSAKWLNTRPWMTPQKFLWVEDGGNDKISSMTAFYGFRDQVRYIKGLSVRYQSGLRREVGNNFYPTISHTVAFDPNDKPCLIELVRDDDGLLDVLFHYRTANETQHKIYSLADAAEGTVYRKDQTCQIDLSSHSCRFSWIDGSRDKEAFPPGEVVGLWGFEIAEYDLSIGVVLLVPSGGERYWIASG